MNIVEQSALIANMYENKQFDYIKNSGISYMDISLFLLHMDNQLSWIENIQDDKNYEYQLKTTFKLIPKKVENVVSKGFIDEVLSLETKHITSMPSKIREDFETISLIAFKFQLKYCIKVFEDILCDEELWKDLQI